MDAAESVFHQAHSQLLWRRHVFLVQVEPKKYSCFFMVVHHLPLQTAYHALVSTKIMNFHCTSICRGLLSRWSLFPVCLELGGSVKIGSWGSTQPSTVFLIACRRTSFMVLEFFLAYSSSSLCSASVKVV